MQPYAATLPDSDSSYSVGERHVQRSVWLDPTRANHLWQLTPSLAGNLGLAELVFVLFGPSTIRGIDPMLAEKALPFWSQTQKALWSVRKRSVNKKTKFSTASIFFFYFIFFFINVLLLLPFFFFARDSLFYPSSFVSPTLVFPTMKFSSTVLLALASYAVADTVTCSSGQQCPEDKPCCSLYGECGTGSYCVGPCNPKLSYNLTSCAPAPICKSGSHQFTTTDSIISNTKYLGDAGSHDFVVNNDIVSYDDSVLLTMANGSTGTVLTSTRAVWYGKVSATLKTSRTQGVVSSFILMSGVRDEIDYEFIGSFLETAQTNYYWQENLVYTNSRNISLSDTFENFHTYEIDWTEESITWSVDGQVGRVLNRADTWNETSNRYDYPQTPSFLQVSLWPGGLASNAEGTRNWAGGEIDWNAADIQDPGYFYVTLKDITVNCYDAPANTPSDGSNSYVYTDIAGLSGNVKLSGDGTVLGSFEAVGFDMDKGSDSDLADVSGSVPTGIGSGNNHSADDSSDIPTASAVSISSTKKTSSSVSLADVTGTVSTTTKHTSSTKSVSIEDAKETSSTKAAETSDASESSEFSAAETTAAATTSAIGGFEQSSDSTTSAAGSNGAVKVFASVFAIGASALAAVLVI